MSAFQLSDKHISYLVNALHQLNASDYVQIPDPDPTSLEGHMIRASNVTDTDLGQYLVNVNSDSLNYLYAHHSDNHTPHTFRYDSRYRTQPLDNVQVIKAAQCYEYQSCEHPGWKDSPASQLIECLISAAIHKLPGYSAAAWSID